jgi:hypothetical protein
MLIHILWVWLLAACLVAIPVAALLTANGEDEAR